MTADPDTPDIVLRDRSAVLAALEDDALVPPAVTPPGGASPASGSTMALRQAMARFSPPADHADRRAVVVQAIDRIDASAARAAADHRTRMRLDGRMVDAVGQLAAVVPTEALVLCLGGTVDGRAVVHVAAEDDLSRDVQREVAVPLPAGGADVEGTFEAQLVALVADVEAMVRVIGRGEPATAASDAAVDRLSGRYADHPSGVVPVLSMLYQTFDATAALVGTTLLAMATGRPAVPGVPRTRRRAQRDTWAAGIAIPAGAPVTLEIGAAGVPFGAGPHACPGQVLAEQIVAGMTAAVEEVGYRIDLDAVRTDADGRPTTLPLSPPAGPSAITGP